MAELPLNNSRDYGHVEVLSNIMSTVSSYREMEGGTNSSASSVLNKEVELAHTVMDRGMVNNVPTTKPVNKFRSYLVHCNCLEISSCTEMLSPPDSTPE